MIVRRRPIWSKKTREATGSNCPDLALAKGQTREEEKLQKREAHRLHVDIVRRHVWARSGGKCELCRETEADAVRRGEMGKLAHEMHECYSRAHTRKMPPELRFQPNWCIRCCPRCHRLQTHGRFTVAFFTKDYGAEAGPGTFAAVLTDQFPLGWYTAEAVWRYVAETVVTLEVQRKLPSGLRPPSV